MVYTFKSKYYQDSITSWTDTDDLDRIVLHPFPGERVKVLPAVMQVIGTVDVIVLEVPTRKL